MNGYFQEIKTKSYQKFQAFSQQCHDVDLSDSNNCKLVLDGAKFMVLPFLSTSETNNNALVFGPTYYPNPEFIFPLLENVIQANNLPREYQPSEADWLLSLLQI